MIFKALVGCSTTELWGTGGQRGNITRFKYVTHVLQCSICQQQNEKSTPLLIGRVSKRHLEGHKCDFIFEDSEFLSEFVFFFNLSKLFR